VASALAKLDNGIHVGRWGQLQEWKLDIDTENDTHRHLSGLVGWYPGYSVSGPHGANSTVQDAVETLLWSRGPGNADDADAGWEKVWRAACWAGLNNTERAFFELSYAIDENFAANGLSMYSALEAPFQIDANFGLVGAVTSMLIRDLPQTYGDKGTPFAVLGPAIPASWAGGSVSGMRLRGGGSVDFSWDDSGMVDKATIKDRTLPLELLNMKGDVVAKK
jgi:alpha-L-fucosidase 2